MNALKPCPLCGNTVKIIDKLDYLELENLMPTMIGIQCDCGIKLQWFKPEDRMFLITAWNTRKKSK